LFSAVLNVAQLDEPGLIRAIAATVPPGRM
jgi:hypothetical protein